MKTRNILLCCALLGALSVAGRAMADVDDEFVNGFDPSIPWTWNVPGNDPMNTADPNNYSFSSNSLDIMVQGGSLYGNNNNAHNIPSLVILGVPGDGNWYVETAVSTDWTMADTAHYVHAGLVFFTDADNYFSFYNNMNPPVAPMVQVSTTKEFAAIPKYADISYNSWNPTTDPVILRVEFAKGDPDLGTPDTISLFFDNSDGNGLRQCYGSPISSGNDVFNFISSSVVGMQIGLETDSGGGFNTTPFSFHYFKTNLTVTQ